MTVMVVGIVALACMNFAYKAAGPALLLDREPSPTVQELVISLSPALLTGLVVVELAGPRWADLDWTTLPPLAAGVAYRLGVPDLVCILIAVGLAAGLRAGLSRGAAVSARSSSTRRRLVTLGAVPFFRRKGPEPEVPATIEDAMASQAEDFVAAFTGAGSPVPAGALDYSRASLRAVDGVLDDFDRQEAALPEDLHFLAGAYVSEVARREFGGRYLRGDEDNPFVLVLGEPACQIGVLVFEKVRGRATNGPEDDLDFFYAGIAPALAQGVSSTLM